MPSLTRAMRLVARLSLLGPSTAVLAAPRAADPNLDVLANMLDAMTVMQEQYYKPWQGTWPDAIDWTGAVMDTFISAGIRSFTEALPLLEPGQDTALDWQLKTNLIDTFFSQVIGYYFGENATEIRQQAYDDILWVSLGWNEAIKFVNAHTDMHFQFDRGGDPTVSSSENLVAILANQTYYGNHWVSTFSHRARDFWDFASEGWDETLCDGGMNWNPELLPYKNAITNQLWISASTTMYLNYPGDDNGSPYPVEGTPQDPKYLDAAREGYQWMKRTNFLNDQGLYIDGFHISGLGDNSTNNTQCDERNTEIYTYNQGVILTGLRGLFQAEQEAQYLDDGHVLTRNVIKATGWDLETNAPIDDVASIGSHQLPPWHGMGRAGILEEACDASGECSQDAQTFKGIYFHHLTAFCEPFGADEASAAAEEHATACASYTEWIRYNAEAALATRDEQGRFGMWWTAGLLQDDWVGPWPNETTDGIPDAEAVDYRNEGVPNNRKWRYISPPSSSSSINTRRSTTMMDYSKTTTVTEEKLRGNMPLSTDWDHENSLSSPSANSGPHGHSTDGTNRHVDLHQELRRQAPSPSDPNDRGRGRTVETQGGGVALLRASWQITQAP